MRQRAARWHSPGRGAERRRCCLPASPRAGQGWRGVNQKRRAAAWRVAARQAGTAARSPAEAARSTTRRSRSGPWPVVLRSARSRITSSPTVPHRTIRLPRQNKACERRRRRRTRAGQRREGGGELRLERRVRAPTRSAQHSWRSGELHANEARGGERLTVAWFLHAAGERGGSGQARKRQASDSSSAGGRVAEPVARQRMHKETDAEAQIFPSILPRTHGERARRCRDGGRLTAGQRAVPRAALGLPRCHDGCKHRRRRRRQQICC